MSFHSNKSIITISKINMDPAIIPGDDKWNKGYCPVSDVFLLSGVWKSSKKAYIHNNLNSFCVS